MVTPDRPSAELLDRYFVGTCTNEEAERVRRWAEQELGGLSGLDAMHRLRLAEPAQRWRTEVGWNEMRMRLERTVPSPPDVSRELSHSMAPKGPRRFRSVWYAAATACIALTFLALGWNGGVNRLNRALSTQISTYTTMNGERATITLPDGSKVLLNAASRLEVPANFANGNRTLHLEGAALFTVNHDAQSPFTVMAGGSTTRVLGTSFVVRHYASDNATTVSVRDGKVAVGSAIVTANQQVTVDANHTGAVVPADPGQFSFESGVLTLEIMPLEAAIPELNRWYDAEIRFGDPSIRQRLIAGRFTAGSLSDASTTLTPFNGPAIQPPPAFLENIEMMAFKIVTC